jgi:hypothetical protein
MIDIPHVKLKTILPIERVSSTYLRESGYSWSHLVAPRLLRCIERQVVNKERSRTNQTHVSAYHIPELRQLIETGSSEGSS